MHAPVSAPSYSLTSDVVAAWFLDEGKISVRSPLDFVRFYTVQAMRPWFTGGMGPPPMSDIFRQGIHSIGLAGFSAVVDREEYYFEWQFGGCFGRGSTFLVDQQGNLHEAENIYIS